MQKVTKIRIKTDMSLKTIRTRMQWNLFEFGKKNTQMLYQYRPKDSTKIIRQYFEQPFSNKLENLKEMDKFFETLTTKVHPRRNKLPK